MRCGNNFDSNYRVPAPKLSSPGALTYLATVVIQTYTFSGFHGKY
jgi:hypothetical protein